MCSARAADRSRTLVVGLGNPLRGDDGVGWRIVDALRAELVRLNGESGAIGPVELDQLAVGGLTLMERLVGYRRAILVDAIWTGAVTPGTVTCRPLDEIETRAAAHLDSAHDAPLPAALAAGRAMGAVLPAEIVAVAVEAERVDRFGAELSPAVATAVPVAVTAVLQLLGADGHAKRGGTSSDLPERAVRHWTARREAIDARGSTGSHQTSPRRQRRQPR